MCRIIFVQLSSRIWQLYLFYYKIIKNKQTKKTTKHHKEKVKEWGWWRSFWDSVNIYGLMFIQAYNTQVRANNEISSEVLAFMIVCSSLGGLGRLQRDSKCFSIIKWFFIILPLFQFQLNGNRFARIYTGTFLVHFLNWQYTDLVDRNLKNSSLISSWFLFAKFLTLCIALFTFLCYSKSSLVIVQTCQNTKKAFYCPSFFYCAKKCSLCNQLGVVYRRIIEYLMCEFTYSG